MFLPVPRSGPSNLGSWWESLLRSNASPRHLRGKYETSRRNYLQTAQWESFWTNQILSFLLESVLSQNKFPNFVDIEKTTGWRYVLIPIPPPPKKKGNDTYTLRPTLSVGMYGCLEFIVKKIKKSNGNEIIYHTVDGRNPANQLIWRISHVSQVFMITGGAGFLPVYHRPGENLLWIEGKS